MIDEYKYMPEKPCRHGHMSPRYKSNNICVECDARYKEKRLLNQRIKYWSDPEKIRERKRAYHHSNKESRAEYAKKYRQKNKEKISEYMKEYNYKNPEHRRAASAGNRAKRKSATPDWVNRNELREVYATAEWLRQQTGLDLEVDHIIPIGGKTVCGLHVPWNLQIISKSQNRQKTNTYAQD